MKTSYFVPSSTYMKYLNTTFWTFSHISREFSAFLMLIYLCCKQISANSTDCDCDYCNYYICKHSTILFAFYLQYLYYIPAYIRIYRCIYISILKKASPNIDIHEFSTYYIGGYLYISVRLHHFLRNPFGSASKDDQIKLFDNKNKNEKIAKTGNKRTSRLAMHFDTLDQGTEAFMQWLGSDDKMSASSNPISLKQFVHGKYSVLFDNNLNHDVIVETHDGVPFCKICNADDCGHVGFTILLEQKFENDGTIFD